MNVGDFLEDIILQIPIKSRNKNKLHELLNMLEPVNSREIESKENIIHVQLPEYGLSMKSDVKKLVSDVSDSTFISNLQIAINDVFRNHIVNVIDTSYRNSC